MPAATWRPRVEELTRTDSAAVRRPLERSIARLDSEKKEAEARAAFVEQEIRQLNGMPISPSLRTADRRHIRRHIREGLSKLETTPDRRVVVQTISTISVHRDHIRLALLSVSRSESVSALSVLAPASRQKANSRPPSLNEDRLPLPGRFLLSDPARLASMHELAGLSARQIAARLDLSHSAALAALGKLGITTDGGGNGHVAKGQVPFGWDFQDSRFVKNGAEQQVIRLIRQPQSGGEWLNGIARELNRRLVPTKNARMWQANTVGQILDRIVKRG